MSNVNESSDFASFLYLFQQYMDSRSQGNSQPLTGPQQPPSQVRRVTSQHLSPTLPRPPPRPTPFRNTADLSALFRALDDVKKRQEEIYVVVSALRTMSDQIKRTVEEGVATMVGTMERFEIVGRRVLEMAVQPPHGASSQPIASNPAPSQYASQPPTSSNPQKPYSGTNAAQPPHHTPHLYPPSASQAQEPFSEPYMEYSGGFDFLANDTS